MLTANIAALTGVRAVAVLLVFFSHLQQRYFPYSELAQTPVANAPYFGMTAFFVLSGFVIHWNYGLLFAKGLSGATYWTFFVARFSRLWPLHFAVSLLALSQYHDFQKFLEHVFLVQSWAFEGLDRVSFYNTWSISTEWFLYLAYAVCYPLLATAMGTGRLWKVIIVVGACLCISYWLGPNHNAYEFWIRYYAPYPRLCEFLTGVVVSQLVISRRTANHPILLDAGFVFVFAVTAYVYGTPFEAKTNLNYFIAPTVAALLIAASDENTLCAKALSSRWLLWVGDRSYSIYLLEAVYLTENYRIETPLGYAYASQRAFNWQEFGVGLAWSAFGVALVFGAADLCWRYFEMPVRTRIKAALLKRG